MLVPGQCTMAPQQNYLLVVPDTDACVITDCRAIVMWDQSYVCDSCVTYVALYTYVVVCYVCILIVAT